MSTRVNSNLRGVVNNLGAWSQKICARFVRVPPPITNPGSVSELSYTHHHVHGSSGHNRGNPWYILEHLTAESGISLKDVHASLMVGLRDVLKDVRQSSLVEGTRTKKLHC